MGLSAISLFSGAGGLDLAAAACGIRTVCYVEWDAYAQGVLMSRIRDGGLDDAPIWDDVTTFDGAAWRGKVDIVFGGFPCQPHSAAGKRGGANDSRNLWPDTMRILRESGAWGFVGENVPGILTNGFAAQVMADLERADFCGVVFSNTACAVGAPHPRERVFFVAHAAGRGRGGRDYVGQRQRLFGGEKETSKRTQYGYVPTAACSNSRDNGGTGTPWREGEPRIERVVDGMAFAVDRLRCCGNGVVPSEAIPAFQKLKAWAGIQ